MNERLSTRSLAEHLANQTGLDRKSAEDFIDALTYYFTQGLERNKVVKIFGLGVFKIMLVRERESVHIQTGERFVIPAHHKLTFVPDKNFKDQINRPFALFEPIEAPESDFFEFNYENELPESILRGDNVSNEDERSELSALAKSASYEDELPDALTDNASNEDELPESTGVVYEDELPESTNTVYEDELPESTDVVYEDELPESTDAVYEDELPESTNTVYEDELPESTNTVYEDELPESTNAVYEDELPESDSVVYEDELPESASATFEDKLTPLLVDDYFNTEFVNEFVKSNDEETFFEDFANEKESKTEAIHGITYGEQEAIELMNGVTDDEDDNDLEYNIQAVSESLSEELPYDIVSVSTTYTHKPDVMEAPVAKKRAYQDNVDVTDTGKKRKKMLLWFYLIVIPLCVIIGSIIGAYIFLGLNSDRTLKVKQNQDISNVTSLTDFRSASPVDVDTYNLLPDTPTPELDPNPEDNENLVSQNENIKNDSNLSANNSSESNTSDTNSLRRQDLEPVDWLVPTPDNVRTNGTRRVTGPNRALEERNRALSNNSRQSSSTGSSGSTARTSTSSNTSNARTLPTSVRMRAGSTLTQFALDYYGNKVFWVYIYEHNRSRISDPHKIPIGTELQLPAPSAYGIDSKNAASLQRAAEKQAQYN